MAGLIDGGGVTRLGLLQILKPTASANAVSNPSFETNTAGWNTTSGAALTRVAGGRRGAWCGQLLASSGSGGGAQFAVNRPAVPTVGTLSVDVWSDSNNVIAAINSTSSVTIVHPGDSQWHRLECTLTVPAGPGQFNCEVDDLRSSGWTNVLIDGMMFEFGTAVAGTYIDGDQDGCAWDGAPHGSTSTRDGRDGRGGQIVSLDSLGLFVKNRKGFGAPVVDVATQTLALADGELFQRSRNGARQITLQSLIIGDGTGITSYHAHRRPITDIVSPAIRRSRGPITLRYIGSSRPKTLPIYYQKGLELDALEGIQETPDLEFIAPQSDWISEIEENAALTGSTSTASAQRISLRNTDGSWTTMNGGPTTAPSSTQEVHMMKWMPNGLLAVANNFGGSERLDFWTPGVSGSSQWTSFGAMPNGAVNDIGVAPDGTIVVVGAFTTIGGISANRMARLNLSTSTWTAFGTGLNGSGNSVMVHPITSYVYVSGGFTTANGVTITSQVAYWDPVAATFVACTAGQVLVCPAGGTSGITIGPDGRIYVIASTGAAPGLYASTNGVAFTIFAATPGSFPLALVSYGGSLYVGVQTSVTIGGVAVVGVGRYRGGGWEKIGTAEPQQGISLGSIWSLALGPDGMLYAVGSWNRFSNLFNPDGGAQFDGSRWSLLDVDVPTFTSVVADTISINKIAVAPDGKMAIGWRPAGGGTSLLTALLTPGITTVTNSGSSEAYPVISVSDGAALVSLVNLTTGQAIRFVMNDGTVTAVSPGPITIDLRPGQKTVQSLVQSMMTYVVPTGDIDTWSLVPGANRIALFAEGATASMHWKINDWTVD